MNHIALGKLQARKQFALAKFQDEADVIYEGNISDNMSSEADKLINLANQLSGVERTIPEIMIFVTNQQLSQLDNIIKFFIETNSRDNSNRIGPIYKELLIAVLGEALVRLDVELNQIDFTDLWE